MKGTKENSGMATTQVSKLAVLLKGFGTSIFSSCGIPLRQAGHSNLKFLMVVFFKFN